MADFIPISTGSGATVATDQSAAGAHYQIIKVADGTADSTTVIAADEGGVANALRVVLPNDFADGTYIGDIKFGESLPAGTAAIGKLAANSGVDIGDVDVKSIAAGANYIGLATVDVGNTVTVDLGGNNDVSLNAGANYVGLATVDVGSALPAGDNNIGNVDIATIAAGDNNIGNVDIASIAAGDNNIGNVDIASALPAGSNAIGKLAANSGVDIGDVDVTSISAGANYIGLVTVDIGSALPAGSNAIGKLAANSGVDIGDVDVTSIAAGANYIGLASVNVGNTVTVDLAGNNDVTATGNVAHDAADSGNPLKLGGRAQDIIGANPEEVADNDRVDALFDTSGRLGVTAGHDYKYADINDATSGNNTIVAATAGKRIAVWAILIVSDGTVDVRWEDGAAGTAFTGQVPLQAREGYSISAGGLVPLFVGSSNTLLNLELSAAINVHGFVSYTLEDD